MQISSLSFYDIENSWINQLLSTILIDFNFIHVSIILWFLNCKISKENTFYISSDLHTYYVNKFSILWELVNK